MHSKYFCYGSLACSLLLPFSLYPGHWTGCICSQSRSHCLPVHQEDRIIRTSFRPEALLFLHHTQHPIVWIYLGPKSILNWFHSWQICVFHLVLGPGFHMNISNHFIFFQVEVLLHADNLYMTSENEKIKGWLKTRQIPVFARVQQTWFLLWKEQWQNLSLQMNGRALPCGGEMVKLCTRWSMKAVLLCWQIVWPVSGYPDAFSIPSLHHK